MPFPHSAGGAGKDAGRMNIWPSETEFLVKMGACMVPSATGFMIAEGVAMKTRMFGAARIWAWLAGILLGAVTICLLAGAFCWAWFEFGPGKTG